ANTKGCAFGYYTAQATVAAPNFSATKAYILWSFGPDHDEKSSGQIQSSNGSLLVDDQVTQALTVNNFQPLIAGASLVSAGDKGAFTYDPTNGTISKGDVWRFSGQ
ncbi:MAG: hypothetical protein ABI579_06875, partial [Candidatus Sumerlaeota bacterium]